MLSFSAVSLRNSTDNDSRFERFFPLTQVSAIPSKIFPLWSPIAPTAVIFHCDVYPLGGEWFNYRRLGSAVTFGCVLCGRSRRGVVIQYDSSNIFLFVYIILSTTRHAIVSLISGRNLHWLHTVSGNTIMYISS